MRNKTVAASMAFTLTLMTGLSGWSAPLRNAPLRVNPAVLRDEMMHQNLSILEAMNQVQQAKIKINLARAQLLPSLNLGLSTGHGSGFFMSAVSVLLPFLVPSNWFNLAQSKYMFEAEKDSYYLMELNLFALVQSTYSTIVGDMGLRQVLKSQYDNLVRVSAVIRTRYDFGLASQSELLNAQAQAKLARVQLSQIDELLQSERATLREAMALPLIQEFIIEEAHVPASPFESKGIPEVAETAVKAAPEFSQINSLILAGEEGNWSRVFAFVNNGALSSSGSGGKSASFSNLSATANVSLGFAMVPAYQLSKAAVDQLYLRRDEIILETGKVIEQTLTGVKEATLQLDQATQAEASLQKVFEFQLQNYNLGYTDLLHVLDAQRSVTQASTAKINSRIDLDHLRINLHRALMTDQFHQIPRCLAAEPTKGGVVKEVKDFFSSAAIQKSVEEMCRGPQ